MMGRPLQAPGPAPANGEQVNDKQREKALVDAVRRGQGEAFAELVQPHLTLLYRLAARICLDAASAEDAVQDALVAIYSNLERYQPGTSFKAFASAVAVSKARTLRRSELRRRRREEQGPEPTDHGTNAHDELAAAETRERIRQALNSMPEKRRNVALLRFEAGLPYGEIGASLGISEASARVHAHHARRELKTRLEAHERMS